MSRGMYSHKAYCVCEFHMVSHHSDAERQWLLLRSIQPILFGPEKLLQNCSVYKTAPRRMLIDFRWTPWPFIQCQHQVKTCLLPLVCLCSLFSFQRCSCGSGLFGDTRNCSTTSKVQILCISLQIRFIILSLTLYISFYYSYFRVFFKMERSKHSCSITMRHVPHAHKKYWNYREISMKFPVLMHSCSPENKPLAAAP